ncbi:MAG: diphosphomevalonate decarboxylase [Candidatus Woesebacteria bacterium]|jgi:diphosphomevalonate decarboxylase
MRASAKAPANIAFIKYWGKKDAGLRIPMNNSVSMNLSNVYSTTQVVFNKSLTKDIIYIDGRLVKAREKERVVKHLDRIRKRAGINNYSKVESNNNFPRGTGMASSASGFAALTLAATKAAGLKLSEKELSILARLASGSACRSIPDGFVEWVTAEKSENSFAKSIYPPSYWQICDIVAVVGLEIKKVSSTKGHTLVESSPFYKPRIEGMLSKVRKLKDALRKKDFTAFGEIVEAEAVNMHAVMMTSKPALYYWLPITLEIMRSVTVWRNKGLESYFTLDAGPNVHVICKKDDREKIRSKLLKYEQVKQVIINTPAKGALLV